MRGLHGKVSYTFVKGFLRHVKRIKGGLRVAIQESEQHNIYKLKRSVTCLATNPSGLINETLVLDAKIFRFAEEYSDPEEADSFCEENSLNIVLQMLQKLELRGLDLYLVDLRAKLTNLPAAVTSWFSRPRCLIITIPVKFPYLLVIHSCYLDEVFKHRVKPETALTLSYCDVH